MMSLLIEAWERLRSDRYLVDPPRAFDVCDSGDKAADTRYLVAGTELNPLVIDAGGAGSNNLGVGSSGTSTQASRILVQGQSNVIVLGRDAKMHNADIRVPGNNCLFYFGAFSIGVQFLCFLCGSGRRC